MSWASGPPRAITGALELLDKHRLVLAIHDPCFPSRPAEDLCRGTPYSGGGRDFVRFARSLGFDGLQLGPQGLVSRSNPSPYDSTLFSRNVLNIDLFQLAEEPRWGGLLRQSRLHELVAARPQAAAGRVQHGYAFDAYLAVLDELYQHYRAASGSAPAKALAKELAAFTERHRHWLAADSLYYALAARQGGGHHRDWPVADRACADATLMHPPPGSEAACQRRRLALEHELAQPMERFALAQLIVHEQHQALRAEANASGMRLYGDLQVGLSACDEWQRAHLYLPGYRLGAPPSRTNPEGQPWGYGILDPALYVAAEGKPGPALRFLHARVEKFLDEFDGLRIDHPHGLVCPWVYRSDDPDPLHAVQNGARLFAAPALEDHPELAQYAIARVDQLSSDPATAPHADDWVRSLEPDQVARYSTLLDALVAAVSEHGGSIDDVVCEVLSTQPYPLQRTMERHGLGRFRVTQKADLLNPGDVYRSENARPEDWIMAGNHDTPAMWRLVRQWAGTSRGEQEAAYLARRLQPEGDPSAWARELAAHPGKLLHAKVADIFASRARHVAVFFSDLLGLAEDYNRPGTVSAENWSLRVPNDYHSRYASALKRGEALNLPRVMALALRSRGADFVREHATVVDELDRLAGWWPPTTD